MNGPLSVLTKDVLSYLANVIMDPVDALVFRCCCKWIRACVRIRHDQVQGKLILHTLMHGYESRLQWFWREQKLSCHGLLRIAQLKASVLSGNIEMVSWAIDRGVYNLGLLATFWEFCVALGQTGNVDMIKMFLVDKRAVAEPKHTPLFYTAIEHVLRGAIRNGHLHVLTWWTETMQKSLADFAVNGLFDEASRCVEKYTDDNGYACRRPTKEGVKALEFLCKGRQAPTHIIERIRHEVGVINSDFNTRDAQSGYWAQACGMNGRTDLLEKGIDYLRQTQHILGENGVNQSIQRLLSNYGVGALKERDVDGMQWAVERGAYDDFYIDKIGNEDIPVLLFVLELDRKVGRKATELHLILNRCKTLEAAKIVYYHGCTCALGEEAKTECFQRHPDHHLRSPKHSWTKVLQITTDMTSDVEMMSFFLDRHEVPLLNLLEASCRMRHLRAIKHLVEVRNVEVTLACMEMAAARADVHTVRYLASRNPSVIPEGVSVEDWTFDHCHGIKRELF